MPTVPTNKIIPMPGVQPSKEHLLMAAATMHEMGKLQPAMEKDAIARFGRPNIKADVPTADKLKDLEKKMEGQQRYKDYKEDEDAPFEVKGQNI